VIDQELLTIGQLARRTGLPVRTIRFWSDSELIPPTTRSTGNYRLYDAAALGRLELIRTLRELGIDLDTVHRVLTSATTVAEVAGTHARALDAEIRTLSLRRAVLRSIARRASTTEEMRLVNDMARLSAEQRQQIIDEFVDETFADIPQDAPGAWIAKAMRTMPTELPDEPTDEQVDAWLELAALVADPAFRESARRMAVTGADPATEQPSKSNRQLMSELGSDAVKQGIAPDSRQGQEILARLVDPDMSRADRIRLADQIDLFTDAKVERYWELVGVLNNRPPFPRLVPAFEWMSAALRAG
jgi:DNA-binding transcriptional MerR regulator